MGEARHASEWLDEIESYLKIQCTPVTWPIGMGSRLKGVYHLLRDEILLYSKTGESRIIRGLDSDEAVEELGSYLDELREEIELVQGACPAFSLDEYLMGEQTPVFFGSALHNFGVEHFLDYLAEHAPAPRSRMCEEREVLPTENSFSGFVFKIQANMDPAHRDRIAFVRICSGEYRKGIKLRHVRLKRDMQISNAMTFMAGERDQAEQAWAGDIIGLHNHGTIQVGDSFSEGEILSFQGIPHFAPELFRRVQLRDPLKMKALLKGLIQLGEEGATQVFRPMNSNDLIVGAIGSIQFDVVAWRLKDEYNVECSYDNIPVTSARWVSCDDEKLLQEFKRKASQNLALDGGEHLTYLAPSMVNLNLTMERWPDIAFHATREH